MERFAQEHFALEEPLGYEPTNYLHWNVCNTSDPRRIVSHLRKIEKSEGQIGIFTLLEVPIPDLRPEGSSCTGIADYIADELEIPEDRRLFMPRAFHKDRWFQGEEEAVMDGVAIFSRYPIVEDSFDHTLLGIHVGGWDIYKKRFEVPQLLKAAIQTPGREQRPLRVGATHLSTPTRHPVLRAKEVAVVSENMGALDVVSLDANAGPKSRYVQTMGDILHRVDDDTPTHRLEISRKFLGKKRTLYTQERKLDYIFGNTDEIDFKEVVVIGDRGPSDHNPVRVTLT